MARSINYRAIIILLTLSLISRFLFFLTIRPWDTITLSRILQSDCLGYHKLALNLAKYHQFAYEKDGPPDALRTPLYPLLISLGYKIFGPAPWIIIVIQIILSTLSALILYSIIARSVGPQIAFSALLFFTFDPFLIIFTNTCISETLFIFLLLLGVFFFCKIITSHQSEKNYLNLVLTAILFGLTALTRPISVYLPILVVIQLFMLKAQKIKMVLYQICIFTFFFLLTLSPWLIRNYFIFKSFRLSTSGSYNLLYLFVGEAEMERRKKSADSVNHQLTIEVESLITRDGRIPEKLNSFQKVKYWNRLAFHYLFNYPGLNFKHYLLGIFRFFFSVETQYLADVLRLPSGNRRYNPKNYPGLFSMVSGWLHHKSLWQIIIGLGLELYLIFSYSLLLIGIRNCSYYKNSLFFIFFASIVIYFILLTGTAGDARLRLPAIPFYLPFVGIGFNRVVLRSKIS